MIAYIHIANAFNLQLIMTLYITVTIYNYLTPYIIINYNSKIIPCFAKVIHSFRV